MARSKTAVPAKKTAAPEPENKRGRPAKATQAGEESPFASEEEEADETPAPRGKKQSATASWFSEGLESADAELERRKITQETQSSRGTWGFKLDKGAKALVLFLDEKAFVCYVHEAFNGKFTDVQTCGKRLYGKCAADAKNKAAWTANLSIVHMKNWDAKTKQWVPESYTDKKTGEKKNFNPKRRFIMKAQTASIMNGLKDSWGGLKGAVVEVMRSQGDKSPKCGDVFQLKEMIRLSDKAALKKYGLTDADLKPIDYLTELKPMSPEAMEVWAETIASSFSDEPDEKVNY